MLGTGSQVDDGAVLEFDVCVVGGGPAGLTLAAELDGHSHRVCLIESGADAPRAEFQALADGLVELNDDCYENPGYLHTVAVGGTGHRWCISIDGELYLRLGRLAPGDFEQREWLPHSGWPITLRDLEPFYDRALDVCKVGQTSLEELHWASAQRPPLASVEGRIQSPVFVFARRDIFTRELPARLAASPTVTLLRESTCMALESEGGGTTVTRARVKTLDGTQFHVAARVFVLAQGAFEVPRLLLASTDDVPAGLGNAHDLVGRFLCDHSIVKAGPIRTSLPDLPARLAYYDTRRAAGVNAAGTMTLTDKALDDEQILSSALMLVPALNLSVEKLVERPFGRDTSARSPALASAMAVRQSIRRRRRLPGLGRHALNMIRGVDDLAYGLGRLFQLFQPKWSIDRGGWSGPPEPGMPAVSRMEAFQLCEQAPHPDNRITLSEETDALGRPKPLVQFKLGDLDTRSAARAQEVFSDELEAAGLGRLASARRHGLPLMRQVTAHHPSGTTRMADDPTRGVVDADCRVHGTENLFVASASVFPTASFTPPTLTVLALAIRVAGKVVELLAEGGPPGLG